jgi:hypothetical protein
LCQAVEELVSRRKKPEEFEGLIDEAKTLANEWKDRRSAKQAKDRRPLFDGASTATNFLLAALVVLLRRDYERVKKIRRYFPGKFEVLSEESELAEWRAIAALFPEPALKATQRYERKRRRGRRNFHRSIEYQFGGEAAAKWQRLPRALPYQGPTCLDDIFAGEPVNMLRLEELFDMDRHRLSRILQGGEKRRYVWRDVVKIMDSLLEKPRKRPRQSKRGRPPAPPWLNNFDLRARVLSGIAARIKILPVSRDIARSFFSLVRRHLRRSGKQ